VRNTDEDFRSQLVKKLKNGSDALNKLVTEMYVRGLSCADVENSFEDIFGRKVISRSGVSKITEHLWDDFDTWRKRDLSGLKIVYLFLDGIYLAMRQGTDEKEGVLCAYAITSDGQKILLHLALGQRESCKLLRCFLLKRQRNVRNVSRCGNSGGPRSGGISPLWSNDFVFSILPIPTTKAKIWARNKSAGWYNL